jgi:hypothetical protein
LRLAASSPSPGSTTVTCHLQPVISSFIGGIPVPVSGAGCCSRADKEAAAIHRLLKLLERCVPGRRSCGWNHREIHAQIEHEVLLQPERSALPIALALPKK